MELKASARKRKGNAVMMLVTIVAVGIPLLALFWGLGILRW